MKARHAFSIITVLLSLMWATASHSAKAFWKENGGFLPNDGNIYLDPEAGRDNNESTKDNPLRTLNEAARRINQANGKGAITIYLSEGIYGLDATVTFHRRIGGFPNPHV
jgi:hypothetical protein